jgi:hypothetical protein
MPSQQSPQIILPHLNWSLARLKEVIEKEDTDYYRGAALQRFRLTYEVALKAIRAFAKEEGKNFSSDESCFQWIEEKQWLEKKSDWITVIRNYKKVKSISEEKFRSNTYNQLQAHYALLDYMKESMILALNKML